MPIEIRELVIKAAVVSSDASSSGGAMTGSTDSSNSPSDELIKTCVEKIMEILKEKNER